ncbi:MAG: tRNA pseudouridine(38-40) synthase TruA [Actinobacteria bacterium]|nr:tRNA pseudouridine(38-40) synthase TruA [Actinomycetota bacterium]
MTGFSAGGSAADRPAALVRVRIDLAYDGAPFRGFARQAGQHTVQGVLEDALERLTGAGTRTVCAGRTDAGVHATMQTVHLDAPAGCRLLVDLDRARAALDAMCGPAVTVWRVRRVPSSFDARFSATLRRYRYRLCDHDAMAPLWRHDTWHVGGPALDVAAMHAGGQPLVGEHDFSSFCRRRDGQHLIRRIDTLAVRRRRAGLVVLDIAGPAFCHQMVRSVTGCLLAVGRGRRPAAWTADVLAARDRQAVGQVAPPHGLTLVGVSYAPTRSGEHTRAPR